MDKDLQREIQRIMLDDPPDETESNYKKKMIFGMCIETYEDGCRGYAYLITTLEFQFKGSISHSYSAEDEMARLALVIVGNRTIRRGGILDATRGALIPVRDYLRAEFIRCYHRQYTRTGGGW